MDELTQPKLYLRKLGVFNCIVDKVGKDEWKGKESLKVTFRQVDDGALIDGKFKLPLSEIDTKQVKKICEACGKSKIGETVGSNLAVLVAPNEWQGKTFWNPRNYFNAKYLDGNVQATLEGINAAFPDNADKIPF
jgi:hypothetical protein